MLNSDIHHWYADTVLAANSWVRRGWCIARPLPNLESYPQKSAQISISIQRAHLPVQLQSRHTYIIQNILSVVIKSLFAL
jgi:hypothetical protein